MLGALAIAGSAFAAESAATGSAPEGRAAAVAAGIAQLTGLAISPLLVLVAIGWTDFARAGGDSAAALPLHASPWLLIPCSTVLALVLAKKMATPAIPLPIRKALDAAEYLEAKLSALVAAGVLLPTIIGISIDALQEALAHHRPAFLYTVPSFQNPSGTTMSAARRAQLMAVSQAHELLIVADEVYQLLDFGTAPPTPLAAHCHTARVLSLGSFSKICAPGLRLGWIQGASDALRTITQSGVVRSGGGLSSFVSGVMRSLIDLGLADEVLDGLRPVYAERSAVLCRALRELLPAVTFVEPTGGYFVWAQLPALPSAVPSAAEFLPVARAGGVSFHAGARFSSGGGFAQHIRLSFAHYEAPELEEGVRRLARALMASAV